MLWRPKRRSGVDGGPPTAHLRSAARVLTALCEGADVVPGQERIRIDVFFRDNLPDA